MINLHQHTRTGIPGTVITNIPLSANGSIVIDGVPEQYNRSVKWIITVIDSTNSKIQSFELLAVNKFGANADHTIYAVIGDKIKTKSEVNIVMGQMELQMTNNETNPLLINVVRVQMLA